MTTFAFQRDVGERAHEEWRALDRALYRWVRAHGGDALLAATAAWASFADGNGDAALPLGGGDRYGMPPLTPGQIDALRADALVSADPAGDRRPFVIDGANRFYLWRNYAHEREAAALLRARRGSRAPEPVDGMDLDTDLDTLFRGERRAEFEPQRTAVRNVVGRRLFVLTGGPGTGKTTTVLRMLLMLQRRAPAPLAMQIAAPTGKAAQRLVQALRQGKQALHGDAALPQSWLPLLDAIPDHDALTVHRLLGYQPWRNAFRCGAHEPIAADVVVVDEASMIDLAMLRALLAAVKVDATLILVGDADQLTSVATGSVLMDIVAALEADAAGDLVRLRHSFRAEQQLVALNEAVRSGDRAGVDAAVAGARGGIVLREIELPHELSDRLLRWTRAFADNAALRPVLPSLPAVGQRLATDAESARVRAARTDAVHAALVALAQRQLLCALREGAFGAVAVNAAIERILRRHWHVGAGTEWYPGRAVIVTRNDYAAGLFNGDVGVCLADEGGRLQVWFEAAADAGRAGATVRAFAPGALPAHESAFAITIHKSQGSEYGDVAVLLPPDTQSRILSRQLLYTAVSRARSGVELWTSPAALDVALAHPVVRQGGLYDRLRG